MIILAIVIGCVIGALIGINAPTISYTYSGYLAIAIIAALDSVFGGITSVLKGNFNFKVFISGFFGNAILSCIFKLLFYLLHSRSDLILIASTGHKYDIQCFLAVADPLHLMNSNSGKYTGSRK